MKITVLPKTDEIDIFQVFKKAKNLLTAFFLPFSSIQIPKFHILDIQKKADNKENYEK